MNWVSYSLFGDEPKYVEGAIKNALAVPGAYPGFRAVFFVDSATVPKEAIKRLREAGAAVSESARANFLWPENKKIWRMLILDSPHTQVAIFRDADSRITFRARQAVAEWLVSPYAAHVMRDFPGHDTEILAGMWGVNKPQFPQLHVRTLWSLYKNQFADWDNWSDQWFLRRIIWPIIKDKTLQHDEFTGWPGVKSFPVPFDFNEGFVGEIFDENDERIPEHVVIRAEAVERLCKKL